MDRRTDDGGAARKNPHSRLTSRSINSRIRDHSPSPPPSRRSSSRSSSPSHSHHHRSRRYRDDDDRSPRRHRDSRGDSYGHRVKDYSDLDHAGYHARGSRHDDASHSSRGYDSHHSRRRSRSPSSREAHSSRRDRHDSNRHRDGRGDHHDGRSRKRSYHDRDDESDNESEDDYDDRRKDRDSGSRRRRRHNYDSDNVSEDENETRTQSATSRPPSDSANPTRGVLKPARSFEGESTTAGPPKSVRFDPSHEDAMQPWSDFTIQSDVLEDEDALIEKRRRARALLKARHQQDAGNGTPLAVQAMTHSSVPLSPQIADSPMSPALPSESASPIPNRTVQELRNSRAIDSPQNMDLADSEGLSHPSSSHGESPEGPSAADYDPMQEEKERLARQGNAALHDETAEDMQADHTVMVPQPEKKGNDEADEDGDDDDDDDDDDMFAVDNLPEGPIKKGDFEAVQSIRAYEKQDDFDDREGYFKVIPNSLVSHRYLFLQELGKGVFANVVRAWDKGPEYALAHGQWKKTHPHPEQEKEFAEPTATAEKQTLIAIKMVRNYDYMKRTARKEIDILTKLCPPDEPDNHQHIIRLHSTFTIRNHLCIAFENMHASLRAALGQQKSRRFSLSQIRDYARQLMGALAYLRKHELLHGDIKPDNILIDEQMQTVKVADLGSALWIYEVEKAPELVSRFYRPPEVILGIPYDYAIDVWSIGCTLYELLTGVILFWDGESNNGMMRVIQTVRGRYPSRLAKKGFFYLEYFDEPALLFRSVTNNYTTGQVDTKFVRMPERPAKDIKSRVLAVKRKDDEAAQSEDDSKTRTLFVDFLEKCLDMNHERRVSAADALKHAFIYEPRSAVAPAVPQQTKTASPSKASKQVPVKSAPGFRTIV